MKIIRNLVAITAVIMLSGCAKWYTIPEVDLGSSYIPDHEEVDSRFVVTFKPRDGVDDIRFTVIEIEDAWKPAKYSAFLEYTLSQIGFPQVMDERDYARMIIQRGLAKEVSSSTDLVSLYRAAQALGDFLYIRTKLIHTGNSWWRQEIEIIDAADSTVLLSIERDKLLWDNIDTELNYAALNLIRRWYIESAGR